jgi:hypothetical protein
MAAARPLDDMQPSALHRRIRVLYNAVKAGTKRLRQERIELDLVTYLYCESESGRGKFYEETYKYLAKTIGGKPGTWTYYRQAGENIRRHKLNMKIADPNAVGALPGKIKQGDLFRIRSAVNSGAPFVRVRNILQELGYRGLPKQARWTIKAIRAHKKTWADWTPEMQDLVERMELMPKRKPRIRLTLTVNGKVRAFVTN